MVSKYSNTLLKISTFSMGALMCRRKTMVGLEIRNLGASWAPSLVLWNGNNNVCLLGQNCITCPYLSQPWLIPFGSGWHYPWREWLDRGKLKHGQQGLLGERRNVLGVSNRSHLPPSHGNKMTSLEQTASPSFPEQKQLKTWVLTSG